MTKRKVITLLLIVLAVLLILPNTSKAATTYDYVDSQGIKWTYELNSSEEAVNLICKTESIQGAVTIPSSIDGHKVISLGNIHNSYGWYDAAFKDIAGITSITIPDTIVTIGNYAFAGCQGLKTVTMADSVTRIGDSAFNGCTGITSITISKNVTAIGTYAFENCKGLKTITIPNAVTNLSEGIFKGCSGLTGITIPENVTNIGGRAFQNCTGIKKVVIPDNVNNIGNDAFSGCSGLTEITLSKTLTTISSNAFQSCTGLKTIEMPDTVTEVGSYAFDGCRGLKEIKLSINLTEISPRMFRNCTGLTSVVIPENVTTINSEGLGVAYGPFEGCTNLEKILIPDSVVSIGSETFENCNKLTIYGNDGQESKKYAEANDIPFDYIANWNKVDSGADITAPTVESIVVTYASVMGYDKDANNNFYMVPAGAKLVMNVKFSEKIKGTIPTLTLKFGEGENVKVTEGQILEDTITYTYTIKEADKGIMTAVDFSGGAITDEAGNAATLSCPKVVIQYNSGDFVYANGTGTNPDDGKKPTEGTDTGDDSKDETNAGSGSQGGTNQGTNQGSGNQTGTGNNKPNETNKDDKTTSTGKLPQTGLGIGLTLAIVIVLAGCTFAYFKYYRLRDI